MDISIIQSFVTFQCSAVCVGSTFIAWMLCQLFQLSLVREAVKGLSDVIKYIVGSFLPQPMCLSVVIGCVDIEHLLSVADSYSHLLNC